jgi:hypothetical protein
MSMVVCIYEDRAKNLIGVKLTVLSLARHCPTLPIIIICPQPPAAFRHWAESLSNVKLISDENLGVSGWNVKPTILLDRLSEGYTEVVWIDSDIIINNDFRQHFENLDEHTLLTTQDNYWGQQQGGTHRTVTWGLTPGRTFSTTINTGILRVTPQHIDMLKEWQKMLNDPGYMEAQRQPLYNRPLHMLGDQEVLTALLGSVEFSHVPVKMLRRGIDIAQCFGPAGYTPTERLQSLITGEGLPPFVHSMGYKPWQMTPSAAAIENSNDSFKKRLRTYYSHLHLQLSPYTSIAREYRKEIEEDAPWMDVKSFAGRLFEILSNSHPILQGFPLALFDAGVRHVRRFLGIARYRLN